jgi:hypothetical protein
LHVKTGVGNRAGHATDLMLLAVLPGDRENFSWLYY